MLNSFKDFIMNFLFENFTNKFVLFFKNRFQNISERYRKTISSEAFLAFESIVLELYYGSKYTIEIYNNRYPVYVLKGDETLKYPFNELCNHDNIDFSGWINYKKISIITNIKKWLVPILGTLTLEVIC